MKIVLFSSALILASTVSGATLKEVESGAKKDLQDTLSRLAQQRLEQQREISLKSKSVDS